MTVQIRMTRAEPALLRADGDVKQRDVDQAVYSDVTARLGFSESLELRSGKYTYVFGVDRKGKFTIAAVDAATGAPVSEPMAYEVDLLVTELRYHFEVPK